MLVLYCNSRVKDLQQRRYGPQSLKYLQSGHLLKKKKKKTLANFGIVLWLSQFSSVTQSCPNRWPHGLQHSQASLSTTNSWSLLKLMSTESVMPSDHLTLCCPLLLLPSIFPSIRVFSNKSVLPVRWPKYWSFSFSTSNKHSGLISFRMDWLYLLAVQGTLKSLLQHHSSKASILRHSASFMVQLSHSYMTTGKTTALTIHTFVGKIMSLLFNTLSRFVIAFLPRSKRLLISWLQSPSAVILEIKKIKSVTVSIVSPSICHEVMGPEAITWVSKQRVVQVPELRIIFCTAHCLSVFREIFYLVIWVVRPCGQSLDNISVLRYVLRYIHISCILHMLIYINVHSWATFPFRGWICGPFSWV